MSVHRTLPSPKAARSLPRLLPLLAALTLAACGGGGGGEAPPADAPAPAPAPQGTAALFAGSTTENGCVDGPAATARFGSPQGIALDDAGNVYVADAVCNQLRKITPDGNVSVLLAGITSPVGLTLHRPSQKLIFSELTGTRRIAALSLLNLQGKILTFNANFTAEVSMISVNDSLGGAAVRPLNSTAASPLGFTDSSDAFEPATTDLNVNAANAVLSLDVVLPQKQLDYVLVGSTQLDRIGIPNFVENGSAGTTIDSAGDPVASGRQDGERGAARFVGLTGIAKAPGNFAFLADTDNIRQVELSTMNVTTLVPDLGELKGTRQLAATADGKTLYYTTARGVVKVTLP